jgi:hypothetical protein
MVRVRGGQAPTTTSQDPYFVIEKCGTSDREPGSAELLYSCRSLLHVSRHELRLQPIGRKVEFGEPAAQLSH